MAKSVEEYKQEQVLKKECDEVSAIGLVDGGLNSIPHFCHEFST